MPDLILRLRTDPTTGKREVVIDYTSDSDALPMEHEEAHQQLANKVMEGGLKSGKVSVSREEEAPATESGTSEEPVAQPTANKT